MSDDQPTVKVQTASSVPEAEKIFVVAEKPVSVGGWPAVKAGMQVKIHQRIKDVNPKGEERERTQNQNLKIAYNKVHGFYIEITRARADKVPAHYQRRQPLKGVER